MRTSCRSRMCKPVLELDFLSAGMGGGLGGPWQDRSSFSLLLLARSRRRYRIMRRMQLSDFELRCVKDCRLITACAILSMTANLSTR